MTRVCFSPSIRGRAVLAALAAWLLLAACSAAEEPVTSPAAGTPAAASPGPAASPQTTAETAAQTSLPPIAVEALSIDTTAGATVRFSAEIAETREQRTQGLMGRESLAPDTGMLFVIEPPGRGFWMRGTTIPLTVAFIAQCGEIVDFADLEPLSEEIKNTQRPYAFALEMAQGWFAANGVAIGDVVALPTRFLPAEC